MTDIHAVRATSTQREQALADVFVTLADTLVDDYDVVGLLDQLVLASVSLLGVTEAGILLDDQRGSLAVVASSSESTRLLEIFQLQTDEGPCLDCVRTGAAVASGDLAAESERWPTFVPAALEAGFLAMAAVPLRLRDQTVGGLNLFLDRAEPISVEDRRLAQALADVATIGILQRRFAHHSVRLAEQLQHALNSRIAIEQAKGVLAERHGLSMDAAFDVLRRYSRDHNRKLTEVSIALVRGELGVAAVTGRSSGGKGKQA